MFSLPIRYRYFSTNINPILARYWLLILLWVVGKAASSGGTQIGNESQQHRKLQFTLENSDIWPTYDGNIRSEKNPKFYFGSALWINLTCPHVSFSCGYLLGSQTAQLPNSKFQDQEGVTHWLSADGNYYKKKINTCLVRHLHVVQWTGLFLRSLNKFPYTTSQTLITN